jgi:hypothetical protein
VAREVIELVRCDVCGGDEEVEGFTITREGKPRGVDLCDTHKGPLVELYDLGSAPATPAPRKSARSSHAVVAIEDWDPALAEQTRAPAKAAAKAPAKKAPAKPRAGRKAAPKE